MNVIDVRNISKTIGKSKLIKDISFKIESGNIIGLVGRNGAGKTTLMKCLTGLLEVETGSINICTYDINKEKSSALKHVGASIEMPMFYPELTGYDNLSAFSENKKNIAYVIEYIGLKNDILRKVGTYSLGMKARLMVGIALLNNPELLILDEPTNGLDPSGIIELRNILCRLKDEGKTIIISSHILSEIEKMCDEIFFICGGEIFQKVKIGDKNVDLEKIYNEVERKYDEKRYLC